MRGYYIINTCAALRGRLPKGFTVIELMVVIAIAGVLIGIIVPALVEVRKHSKAVVCMSRMRDVGIHLLVYANDNNGWLFPVGRGVNVPREERWPTRVFRPAIYNPAVLSCPADVYGVAEHSYLLNSHLAERGIRLGTSGPSGLSSSEIVLMGEKASESADYYLEAGEFDERVEIYRHGLRSRSNYLRIDWHVDNLTPPWRDDVSDPWDLPDRD